MLPGFVFACLLFVVCNGENNIGCLFSDNLCDARLEWCYDDYAFGRCLPNYRETTQEELFHHDLDKDELLDLEQQLQRLLLMGYQWSHPLTQCMLKEMLTAFRDRSQFDSRACSELSGEGSEVPALGILESDPEVPLDPQNVAFVRYRPSEGNPHPEFADEVYFPPLTDEDIALAQQTPNVIETDVQPHFVLHQRNPLSKKSLRRSHYVPPLRSPVLLPPSGIFSPLYNTPDKFRGGFESRDTIVGDPEDVFRQYNTPDKFRQGIEVKDMEEAIRRNAAQEYLVTNGFDEYNTPEKFREGVETRDENVYLENEVDKPEEITLEKILNMNRNEIPLVDEGDPPRRKVDNSLPMKDGGGRLSPKLERLASLLYATEDGDVRALQEEAADRAGAAGAAYTEGGLVFLPDQSRGNDMDRALDDGLESILGLGFKRPERLDVKKPGPLFTAINRAEQHHVADDDSQSKVEGITASQLNKSLALAQSVINNKPEEMPQNLPMIKKAPEVSRPTPDANQYDVVDTTFAYIGFKQSLTSWHEGRNIVRVVAELLELPPGTLSHFRVDRNEITFKVEPNKLRMNSSEVAKGIERIKEDLKQRTGVEVTRAGIGDKTKLPTVMSPVPIDDHEFYVMSYVLVGAVTSLVIACVALFFLKNHAKSREKLQGLAGPDTEAVGDYQDLCRARMAAKTTPEKPEPIGARIASLSRESEASNNSPSSRSSTSSWSEEPALTNMDISTGHMVLSYMEDHLKNKDRLDQEWVALCAYEAEPCATTHALKPDNVNKNRYADVLPYDHSRVVLNDLANISGGDYINASTITDHDPRSPAYIATQGPLPHTAPHFWQLVWEQGSVVMVMLSRLTEEGNAKCHRYWPEEGSELYHIYEVHLVSEHIWCDDYLVRSFYLKNLKTGETRTVTQFHFLSWPDNGVPTSTKALLEFRRKVNKSYRGRSCPIVVHCSDGVGRTGTYCLIDMVLNRMAKGAKEIDIAATLEHIRDQRGNMVKTKEQFEFVLMAVAEEVNAILKALPAQQQQPPVQPPAQPPATQQQ